MNTHEPRISGTKICSLCKRKLDVICFGVNKRSSDGLNYCCRDCGREKTRISKSKKRKIIRTLF